MADVLPSARGLSSPRLQYLLDVIRQDIEAKRYLGASIVVGRGGKIGLQAAVGTHRSDDPRPLQVDSVFNLLSVTKAFTNVLMLRGIEQGRFALTTKVSSIIPEFSGHPRDTITLYHLMTHRSGLPSLFMPVPGMKIDQLDEVIAAICAHTMAVEEPGRRVHYAPMIPHALMGEMLRRTDPKKRSYQQIVAEDLFAPLGMNESSVGLRPDLRARHVRLEFPARFPVQHLGHSNLGPHGAFEEEKAEMPWVGAISSARDMYRFAEMLRQGGCLDGVQLLSPATIDQATQLQTADLPNELYRTLAVNRGWEPYPAYLGIGFALRGDQVCHTQFGTLTSPRTFGNHGAGSTLFWVDPKLDLTFVCLTSGVMDEGDNIERFQRLSDIAVGAVSAEPDR